MSVTSSETAGSGGISVASFAEATSIDAESQPEVLLVRCECGTIHEGVVCPRCGSDGTQLLLRTVSVPQWLQRSQRGYV